MAKLVTSADLKMVVRILSFLLLFEAIFMLIPALVSWYNADNMLNSILLSAGITTGVGLLGIICTPHSSVQMGKREGYLIVGLVWVVFSLSGMLPFYLSGAIPSYTDAFFETMSGFTTTGASILTNVEALPHSLLLWRSLIQWIGGMGIIVLSLAVLPLLGVSGMSLFVAEVPGPTKSKLHAKLSYTAKILWGLYTLFTLIEAFSLWAAGMEWFDAICHAFTTMATGGFSTKNASIAHWDSPTIEYIIILFMFLAGINFSLFFYLLKGQFRKFFKNEELQFYIVFIAALTVVVAISLFINHYNVYTLDEIVRYALFNVVSIITTTAFVNFDFTQWAPFVWTILLIVMVMGACSGSTSGGIKTVRIVLLLKNSHYEFQRLIHPNAIIPVRFNHQVVRPQLINNVLAFVFLYFLIILVSMLVFTAFGMGFDEAISTAVATVSNVGPGLGSVGPISNYAAIPMACKWYMATLMLIGRLELFTVLLILSPSFWKR